MRGKLKQKWKAEKTQRKKRCPIKFVRAEHIVMAGHKPDHGCRRCC